MLGHARPGILSRAYPWMRFEPKRSTPARTCSSTLSAVAACPARVLHKPLLRPASPALAPLAVFARCRRNSCNPRPLLHTHVDALFAITMPSHAPPPVVPSIPYVLCSGPPHASPTHGRPCPARAALQRHPRSLPSPARVLPRDQLPGDRGRASCTRDRCCDGPLFMSCRGGGVQGPLTRPGAR